MVRKIEFEKNLDKMDRTIEPYIPILSEVSSLPLIIPDINIDKTITSGSKIAKSSRKCINCNIADKVLKVYQTHVLLSDRLIYNDIDILNFAQSIIKKYEILFKI